MRLAMLLTVVLLGLTACASPRPVIYPNDHAESVSEEQIEADVKECKRLAVESGAHQYSVAAKKATKDMVRGGAVGGATGAVGGALSGNAKRGAVLGAATGATASFLNTLLGDSRPNPSYKYFIRKCLTERGYELTGWE